MGAKLHALSLCSAERPQSRHLPTLANKHFNPSNPPSPSSSKQATTDSDPKSMHHHRPFPLNWRSKPTKLRCIQCPGSCSPGFHGWYGFHCFDCFPHHGCYGFRYHDSYLLPLHQDLQKPLPLPFDSQVVRRQELAYWPVLLHRHQDVRRRRYPQLEFVHHHLHHGSHILRHGLQDILRRSLHHALHHALYGDPHEKQQAQFLRTVDGVGLGIAPGDCRLCSVL